MFLNAQWFSTGFLLILVSHFYTLTVHTFLPNYMFQPNVAIIRFEYMFEVIALGQSHINLSMFPDVVSKNDKITGNNLLRFLFLN
jgi:hypothetical protein